MSDLDRYCKSHPIEYYDAEEKGELEIDFSHMNLPRERVIEWTYLPSGRIVVMTENDSFWFEADGTSTKGSYLVPWPPSCDGV